MTLATSPADRNRSASSSCAAGRYDDALQLLAPTLDANRAASPAEWALTLNIAAVCALGLSRLDEAEVYWRRCIAANPAFPDAYNNLGMLLKGLDRLSDAEAVYRALLAVCPHHADAANNLGAVLYAQQNRVAAEASYRHALSIRADYAEAHYNLGIVLHDLGRLHEAEAAYRQSLASGPDAQSLNNLGNVLKDRARLDEAEASYRQALAIRPRYPRALNNLANVLRETHRLDEAESFCRQALALDPDFADAHLGLGVILSALDRMPEAETAYRNALVYRPKSVEAHNNLGSVLWALGRPAEAAEAYRQALEFKPDLVKARHHLGCVLKEMGQFADAGAAYRQAIEMAPAYAGAQVSLAALLLSLGQFDEGWQLFEARYEHESFVHAASRSRLACPQWTGDALAGKSLLVWQEDGMGDMIQFARYLPLIKARGPVDITVTCAPALRRLFQAVDEVDAVIDHSDAMQRASEFDCWTSLMSAPLHAGTTLRTIPPRLALRAGAQLVDRWRERLASLPPGPKIGIAWKGNPRHHNDLHRSLPALAALAPLWDVPGVHFVSLQHGEADADAAAQPVFHPGADIEDLADTAAIVAHLDLVISVDTAIAHLAASLGKACWVMLPSHDTDWRWMHARDDSPWYPGNMRLFRQARGEDWKKVIERVRNGLLEQKPGDEGAGSAQSVIANQKEFVPSPQVALPRFHSADGPRHRSESPLY